MIKITIFFSLIILKSVQDLLQLLSYIYFSICRSKFTNRQLPMNWQGSIISNKPVGWADKSVVAQNQVEMDLISYNSICTKCGSSRCVLCKVFALGRFSRMLRLSLGIFFEGKPEVHEPKVCMRKILREPSDSSCGKLWVSEETSRDSDSVTFSVPVGFPNSALW